MSRKKIVKALTLTLTIAIICSIVAGCQSSGTSKASAKGKKIVIGLSNGNYGTDWRTEMLQATEEAFTEEKANGIISKDSVLKVANAGTDINQQIQNTRNMINQGVNVIILEPNSATALNGVINQAKAAKIPVVAADQGVTDSYAVNVCDNHYNWGKTYATWLAKALNGKGNIVMIGGLAGNPAAVDRQKGADDVFKQYPGIKILQYEAGGWDEAKSQAVMSDLLAAYPKIDGVWVEDSMGLGVLKAFEAANRPLPVMTGDPVVGYFKQWATLKDKGFKTFVQTNPPAIVASGLKIAVRLALGQKMKPLTDNTYYYPISLTVDNSNFNQVYATLQGKPDTYFLDEYLTDAKADALFQ